MKQQNLSHKKTKLIRQNSGTKKEMMWKTGEASLCFLSGEGGANTHLNQGTQFEIFNVVIPQQFIEELCSEI